MTCEEAIEKIYQKKTDDEWIALYKDIQKMDSAERDKIGRDYELLGMSYNAIIEKIILPVYLLQKLCNRYIRATCV